MKQHLKLFTAVAALSFCTSTVRADLEQSSVWFMGLSDDERLLLQSRLILTGHYSALADGEFGQMTYEALLAMQRELGERQTGVLTRAAQDALTEASAAIYQGLGMNIVSDERGLITLIVPQLLLTDQRPTKRGTAYGSPDGSLRLETIRKPLSEQSFADLYKALSATNASRRVTYRVFDESRFVVSGRTGPRSFYVHFTQTSTDSVGYSVEWSDEETRRGTMLATFLASYSYPTALYEELDTESYEVTKPELSNKPSSPPTGSLSAGSGFFVNQEGLIVTNNHVVEGCAVVTVPGYGAARVITADAELDLAAIKVDGVPVSWAAIRTSPVELGEDVVLLGYPLADLMGSSLSVGTGIVSSETGVGGSGEWFTSNVGLQPGNSGGPILDAYGAVVGVAVAKLDDGMMMADSGNVAPNFGFAIKSSEVLSFLSIFRTTTINEDQDADAGVPSVREIVRAAKEYTVQVLCRG
ncbi:serine protease [Devosia sp. 1566]|uniref:serine protease n=1 Tax=Devosia sp. 1566 TaxID=2499144 RepID=UPI000FDBDC81|nr:serine protease [Devosia sp. 1566]